jgi:hypothetical protein
MGEPEGTQVGVAGEVTGSVNAVAGLRCQS